jgi:spore coat-associated protein N
MAGTSVRSFPQELKSVMTRLRVLAANPRLALGALLTLLLAAAAVVGSGADFTASSANPANTFASGTLSIVNSKEGTAVLSASGLRPTGSAVGTVDIQNSGSLSGTFTLSRTAPVDSDSSNPMSGKLNVTVVDCGAFAGATPPTCGDGDDVVKFNGGTLAQMGTAGNPISSLGSYAANEKHRYQFTVQLDGSAGNAYQGDSSSTEFDFNAA